VVLLDIAPFNLQSSFRRNLLHGVMHRKVHLTFIAIIISYFPLFFLCIFISFRLMFTYFLFRLLSSSFLPSALFRTSFRLFSFPVFHFSHLFRNLILFHILSFLYILFCPLFLSFYPSFSVALFFLSVPYASVFLDNLYSTL